MDSHAAGIPSELVTFLVCAGVVVPVFHRLRLSPVLGFLLAGIVVGPAGAARLFEEGGIVDWIVIRDVEEVRGIAEFGVAFLLFVIGLELSPVRLWSMRRLVLGLGGAQVLLTGAALAGIAILFGNPPAAAVVLGACLALSSTAIVLQLLTEEGRLGSEAGRASFAVLLFQDLAVIPILFAVTLMSAHGGEAAASLPVLLAKAGAAIALVLVAGRLLLARLFRLVGATKSPELFMATTLLVILGTGALMQLAGLTLTLGAFLAGLLLAETEYRHEIATVIEPFKGLLLGLFFMSVGMGLDPAAMGRAWLWLLPSILGLIAVKAAIFFGLARAFGLALPAAAESALLFGPAGEFAFVVIGMAAAGGLMEEATAQFMLTVAGASMFLTPFASLAGRRLGKHLAREAETARGPESETIPELEGHYVLCGFGRVGRLLREVLQGEGLDCLAVDRHTATVSSARAEGIEIYFGDAARIEFLKKLRLERAQALILTMDDFPAIERIVRAVRSDWPDIPIFARARDEAHARMLLLIGATGVVPEALEAGLELAELALRGGGYPDEAARQAVHRRRLRAFEALGAKEERTSGRRPE